MTKDYRKIPLVALRPSDEAKIQGLIDVAADAARAVAMVKVLQKHPDPIINFAISEIVKYIVDPYLKIRERENEDELEPTEFDKFTVRLPKKGGVGIGEDSWADVFVKCGIERAITIWHKESDPGAWYIEFKGLDVYIKSEEDTDDEGRPAGPDESVVPGDTIIFALNQIELLPPE